MDEFGGTIFSWVRGTTHLRQSLLTSDATLQSTPSPSSSSLIPLFSPFFSCTQRSSFVVISYPFLHWTTICFTSIATHPTTRSKFRLIRLLARENQSWPPPAFHRPHPTPPRQIRRETTSFLHFPRCQAHLQTYRLPPRIMPLPSSPLFLSPPDNSDLRNCPCTSPPCWDRPNGPTVHRPSLLRAVFMAAPTASMAEMEDDRGVDARRSRAHRGRIQTPH